MLIFFLITFFNNYRSDKSDKIIKKKKKKKKRLKLIISCISVCIVLFFHEYSDISRRKLFKLIIDIRATNIQPIIGSFLKIKKYFIVHPNYCHTSWELGIKMRHSFTIRGFLFTRCFYYLPMNVSIYQT